jgi:MGT family glycosyltransferase
LQIDWDTPNSTISKLAVITQTPKEFDFPNIPHAPAFHYAGPFHDDYGRERVAFPWEKLTGEPLIYASMGTLVNGLTDVFRIILKAVAAISGRQLVLSVGNNIQMDDIGPISANAIVVSNAPQIELLKRAELCITHAGINTTLESLALGVPMVAIPVGFDQPGIAARIAHHGTGEFIQLDELTTERLRGLIEKVLQDPSYRERAHYFQRVISKTRGLDVAADIIEQTFHKYQTEVPRENRSVA